MRLDVYSSSFEKHHNTPLAEGTPWFGKSLRQPAEDFY
jgi:hypothetical protein